MVTHVVVFGSTGLTGLCVLEAALKKGLKIRAFVRDPNKLPLALRKEVEIVEGDVLNYSNVLMAVKGTDGVIVTLGTRSDLSPTTVMSEGLRNITTAMSESSVQVISACLSAFLFFDINSDAVPQRLKELTKEHKRMFDVLRSTELKYIAVFPPHISPDPGTGYVVRINKYISKKVSKYDLAELLVDALNQPEYYRKVIGIASKG